MGGGRALWLGWVRGGAIVWGKEPNILVTYLRECFSKNLYNCMNKASEESRFSA